MAAWHVAGTVFVFMDQKPELKMEVGRYRLTKRYANEEACRDELQKNGKRREGELREIAMRDPAYLRAVQGFNRRFGVPAKFTGLSVGVENVDCERVD